MRVKPASQEPLVIDTAALMLSIARNNKKSRLWAAIATAILIGTLFTGVVGIYYQNSIANKNKQHIDCIVKLFTTPLPPGAKSRVIVDPAGACSIEGRD